MCKQRMYIITVPAEQFESAHEIIDRYYEQGCFERISVNHDVIDQTYQIWMECGTDDYESIKKELRDNKITLL